MSTINKIIPPAHSGLADLVGKDDLAVVPAVDISARFVPRPNAHVGPGHATRSELARYLGIHPRSLSALIAPLKLQPTAVGKFRWVDIWWLLWGISDVPPHAYAPMKTPLLSNAEVAGHMDVHERSIRRDGDRPVSRHGLPPHLDLSARIRRHHPLRVAAWQTGVPLPAWLTSSARTGGLRLTPRRAETSLPCPERQVSDSPGSVGQFDEHTSF